MDIIEYFQTFPPYIAAVIISMLPVVELRGAIPAAVFIYGLPVWQAYIWAVFGNMIAAVILVLIIEPISAWLMKKSKLMDKFFSWIFKRTHRKFLKKHEKWGALGLIIFVAIPLPVTGVWTGSVAAFLFGIRPKPAILYMFAGVLISGIIVSILSFGISNLI